MVNTAKVTTMIEDTRLLCSVLRQKKDLLMFAAIGKGISDACYNKERSYERLVDGKKVIISEASIRRDLPFGDEGGVDCLPNEAIFEQVTLMGSTMASAIICLATNQKFNFSKYIFESMVKNLDSVTKFLMYPRFVQVYLNNQLEEMANHTRIYVLPFYTKKIFGNMKRVGKGFSGQETPQFPTMKVQPQEEWVKDTELPQTSVPTEFVADKAVNEEMNDSLERAATTATSLDAKQDRGNINKTQSKTTLNEPSSIGTSSGSGPKRQDTMEDAVAQISSERVSKISNDPLLVGVNTPQSREDSRKLNELVDLCTNLQNMVLALEATKTTQALEIDMESSGDEGLGEEDASKQGRIADIDVDEDITLVNDQDMFDVNDLQGEELFIEERAAEKDVNAANIATSAVATMTVDGVTLAQALMEINSAKPKATTITTDSTRPKAKGLEDIQAKIDADYQLTERLQAEEQKALTDEEKAKLFGEFLKKSIKLFAAKRAEEKRNKPPTKAQQRSIMSTYLKNMEGYKLKSLKNKSFAHIQKLFDKAMKRVNTFVDYKTEMVVKESSKKAKAEITQEGSSKRSGDELEQERSKKHKMEDDKESEELKKCLEIILDDRDDVTIDATSLSSKSPTIVDYKIYKEGKNSYFQIFRADDNS
nr:hypothetical protein [Tanacetum cinerariifolium]